MVKVLGDSVAEGHRLHLEALIRQERGVDYQRQDYLSPEWQKSLLRTREQKRRDDDDDAIETATGRKVTPSSSSSSSQQQRESPMSTASSSASLFDFDTSVASSLELCIHWRARIIEWKYQVVDRFGTFPREERSPLRVFTSLIVPRVLANIMLVVSDRLLVLTLDA
jgi:hypothetical protein